MEFPIACMFFLCSTSVILSIFFPLTALPPQFFCQAWLQWRELYLYSQNDKQKETRAVAHHQHWELKRCMEVWLGYLNLHRAKKRQNGELGQNRAQSFCLGHSDVFFCSRRCCNVSDSSTDDEMQLGLYTVAGLASLGYLLNCKEHHLLSL